MTRCNFCEHLDKWREIKRQSRKEARESGRGDYRHEYKVALVIRSWYAGSRKGRRSRTVDFRNQGIGFELNYCPECGRYLRRRKQINDQY